MVIKSSFQYLFLCVIHDKLAVMSSHVLLVCIGASVYLFSKCATNVTDILVKSNTLVVIHKFVAIYQSKPYVV